jgi:hypothetical protein
MTISTGNGAAPNLLLTDRLPQCGPIPHMRLTDRPLPPVPGASQRSNTTIYIPVPVPTPKHKGSPVAPSYSRITNVPTRGVQALSPSPALSGSPRPKSPVSLDPSRPYPSPTYSKQPGFAYPHDQTPDDTLDSWCPGWRSCPGSDISECLCYETRFYT